MKQLLLPILAALALPNAVSAEVSDTVHNRCKARDYAGCVKLMTKKRMNQCLTRSKNNSNIF